MSENRWYFDTQISKLLQHYLGSDAVYFGKNPLSSLIPRQQIANCADKTVIIRAIKEGENGTAMPEMLRGLLAQVKGLPNPPKKLLIPVIVNGNHFVSLYVMPNITNPENPTVAYLNSFGTASPADRDIIAVVQSVFSQPEIIQTTRIFQFDGHSCGPITVDALAAFASVERPADLRGVVESYEHSWNLSPDAATQRAVNLRAAQESILAIYGNEPSLSNPRPSDGNIVPPINKTFIARTIRPSNGDQPTQKTFIARAITPGNGNQL